MKTHNMKTQQKKDFGQGSIAANILRLAVPMTLAQLINVLYNVIDRIYIGHIPHTSTEALTGIGLTLPVITIITAFANLFGMGGAPLFSMSRGARKRNVRRRLWEILLLCFYYLERSWPFCVLYLSIRYYIFSVPVMLPILTLMLIFAFTCWEHYLS